MLQTVRHRFNSYASSCVALALCRWDGHCQLVTRIGPLYNEKFVFFRLVLDFLLIKISKSKNKKLKSDWW